MDANQILDQVILVGSWCMIFYREHFLKCGYTPSIRTRDMDFLFPKPRTIRTRADFPELMSDLGFIQGFRGKEGYMILEHPELSVEFLVSERGRGTDKPVVLPQIRMNAQALRFMELLARNTMKVEMKGVFVTVPHPANFALHKLIVSNRRRDKDKSLRDREAAISVIKGLIKKKEVDIIINLLNSLPKKWQKIILLELRSTGEEKILEILT